MRQRKGNHSALLTVAIQYCCNEGGKNSVDEANCMLQNAGIVVSVKKVVDQTGLQSPALWKN